MKRTAARKADAESLPDFLVQAMAACEVAASTRLIGAPVDADTLYLVLSGTLHMTSGSAHIIAQPRSLAIVPAGRPTTIASAECCDREVIATRNTLVRRHGLLVFHARGKNEQPELCVLVGRVAGGLFAMCGGAGDEPVTIPLDDTRVAAVTFQALAAELSDPDQASAALIAAWMKTMLLLAIRKIRAQPHARMTRAGVPTLIIGRIMAKVLASPTENYSVASLARDAGMSRATFVRHFTQYARTTPMDFVTSTRLKNAAGQIAATNMSIKEIAAANGFTSRSHFTRAFGAVFGVTPSEFRIASEPPTERALAIEDAVSLIEDAQNLKLSVVSEQ